MSKFLVYISHRTQNSHQINSVMSNFSDSVINAETLDTRIARSASAISLNYSSILAISTRQAFGAFDLTVPQASSSEFMTDVKAFARNFGNLGSGGYVYL